MPWADLVAPAIRHAEEGYVLDDALPTTLAEGRSVLIAAIEAAREIFLPGGRLPKPGDRFVNRDYGATLRAIATRGASEFYSGEIARQIARDMAEQGGIIRAEDLAQYRAIERAAGERTLPRPAGLLDAAAGRLGRVADRVAAGARSRQGRRRDAASRATPTTCTR